MATRSTELEHVLIRLEALLNEVWDQRPAAVSASADAPLASLGVDSLTLVLLLDKVGSEFHVDWDAETSPGAGSSLRSIADAVLRRDSDSAAEA